MQTLKSIVNRNKNNLAFIVGNGINRYKSLGNSQSWDYLLLQLWNKYTDIQKSTIPKGIELTEFYDVLDLKGNGERKNNLQKEFCDLMKNWEYKEHHKNIIEWAKVNNSPILTTNFENILADSVGATLYNLEGKSFTDYYPWGSYYGFEKIINPADSFGIWHINGMQYYYRSIRLGLSHYMGSVERARKWMHRGNERRLFDGKNIDNWRGVKTWLHIIFNKPLMIFGLKLNATEVFLRWFLIERAKYFQKFPERKKSAWYVHCGDDKNEGKKLFLNSLGIKYIQVNEYEEIYEAPWDV